MVRPVAWVLIAMCWLLLGAGCFGGNGGEPTGGTGAGQGGVGAGQGGVGGAGGTLHAAGTTSVGGGGGSTAGDGGSGGVGGTTGPNPSCHDTDLQCPGGACAPGYVPYYPEGACCPTNCVPELDKCAAVDCAFPECAPGEVSVIPEGRCCPVCMKNTKPSECEDVKTCVEGADCGGAACCDEEGHYFDCYCGNITCALNLRCPDGSDYGCRALSTGAMPPEPPPDVCGCVPTSCPDGQFVIASAGTGTWPDGSPRGTFSCSADSPP